MTIRTGALAGALILTIVFFVQSASSAGVDCSSVHGPALTLKHDGFSDSAVPRPLIESRSWRPRAVLIDRTADANSQQTAVVILGNDRDNRYENQDRNGIAPALRWRLLMVHAEWRSYSANNKVDVRVHGEVLCASPFFLTIRSIS